MCDWRRMPGAALEQALEGLRKVNSIPDIQQQLQAETLQSRPFALEIIERVIDPDFVGFEKRVELIACCKTEGAAKVGLIETPVAVF